MSRRRKKQTMKDETRIAQVGRSVDSEIEVVNPPVFRASTVLYPSTAALGDPSRGYTYGRRGTPTTRALEEAMSVLEGGARTVLTPSGLSAVACALLAFTRAGDHVLVTDACYEPTRRVVLRVLARFGVAASFFDPKIGEGIGALMTPETKLIVCESPGSLTFEVQDLPAIAEAAHARGALVMVDNTWASPLYQRPLALGADISIHSATKYIAGHSDVLLGTITVKEAQVMTLVDAHGTLGYCAAPDDVYLVLRGLRTLGVRMARHQESALKVARWFNSRAEVARVLYPALPDDPGHAVWKRDFAGASGTFGFVLKPCSREAVAAFIDGLKLFGIGYSFGGYESLVLPIHPAAIQRSVIPWREGPIVRLHIGLEDPDDLIADLSQGFARFAEASRS
jgi:cystathionine beta-lyase